jgi:hypothetical protein
MHDQAVKAPAGTVFEKLAEIDLGSISIWTCADGQSMPALVGNRSPSLIPSVIVSFERILGTFLRDFCTPLEERVLLTTIKGLTAVAKFLTEDSKRSQASHCGTLDPHSCQLARGFSA